MGPERIPGGAAGISDPHWEPGRIRAREALENLGRLTHMIPFSDRAWDASDPSRVPVHEAEAAGAFRSSDGALAFGPFAERPAATIPSELDDRWQDVARVVGFSASPLFGSLLEAPEPGSVRPRRDPSARLLAHRPLLPLPRARPRHLASAGSALSHRHSHRPLTTRSSVGPVRRPRTTNPGADGTSVLSSRFGGTFPALQSGPFSRRQTDAASPGPQSCVCLAALTASALSRPGLLSLRALQPDERRPPTAPPRWSLFEVIDARVRFEPKLGGSGRAGHPCRGHG